MKITINEPCHENWDAMTPNQQGAFCKSCMKDVVDFSKMSIEGIKSFFSAPKTDKVCGRFEEKQLQELSFDDFFAKFTYWNFSKKFAVIFFMAFGFWIFSNSSAFAQSNRHMMKGEVMYVPDKAPKKDTTTKIQPPKDVEKRLIKGKIARCTFEPEVIKNEITVKGNAVVQDQPIKEDLIKNENMILGGVVAFIQKDKEPEICSDKNPKEEKINCLNNIAIIDPEPAAKIDSITAGIEKVNERNTHINIYPNPSTGNFVIETNSDVKQPLHIYDESGRIVLSQNISGTAVIDASTLNNGTYNITLTTSEGIIQRRVIIVK